MEAVFDVGPSFVPPDTVEPARAGRSTCRRCRTTSSTLPDLSLLGDFSLFGGFAQVGVVAALLLVFTLMLADFFDTMGTVVGVGKEADLLDEDGRLPGADRVLLVDSLGAVAGGAASASSNDRPTSSPPPASGTARAPAWPAS